MAGGDVYHIELRCSAELLEGAQKLGQSRIAVPIESHDVFDVVITDLGARIAEELPGSGELVGVQVTEPAGPSYLSRFMGERLWSAVSERIRRQEEWGKWQPIGVGESGQSKTPEYVLTGLMTCDAGAGRIDLHVDARAKKDGETDARLFSRRGLLPVEALPHGITCASAKALTLGIAVTNASRVYGGSDDLSFMVTGLTDRDTPTQVLSGGLGRAGGSEVGTYAINFGTLAVTSAFAGKYVLPEVSTLGSYTITPKATTFSGKAGSRAYDGTATVSTAISGTFTPELIGGDLVTVSGGTYDRADASTNMAIKGAEVGGAAAGNYEVTVGTISGAITARTITEIGGVTVAAEVDRLSGPTLVSFDTTQATATGVVESEVADFRAGGLLVETTEYEYGTRAIGVRYALKNSGRFKAVNYELASGVETATLQLPAPIPPPSLQWYPPSQPRDVPRPVVGHLSSDVAFPEVPLPRETPGPIEPGLAPPSEPSLPAGPGRRPPIAGKLSPQALAAARDDWTYERARAENTMESYAAYLRSFASGRHVTQAWTGVAAVAPTIGVNEERQGSLTGDLLDRRTGIPIEVWTLRGEAWTVVSVKLSGGFDASLGSYEYGGEMLSDLDLVPGKTAGILTYIPASGAVTLIVGASDTAARGDFLLRTETLPTIGVNEERAGSLAGDFIHPATEAPVQVWTLQGEARTRLYVDVVTEAFDAYLSAWQIRTGEKLTTDDDLAAGDSARKELTITDDGNVHLVVSAKRPTSGRDYLLRTRTLAEEARLAQLAARTRDDGAWETAQSAGTAAAYSAYLTEYPNGRHSDEVRRLLAEAKDDEAFARAKAAGTTDAYRSYLQRYPSGRHVSEARRLQRERESWSQIARIGDISAEFRGVAWSGSQFVAVGGRGTIIHSEDGRTWTTADSGISEGLRGVAWSGSQFVAVGGRGTIIHSEDGRTWTTADSGTSEFLYGVAWSGSQFMAVGGGGTIIHSEDGRTWTTADSGTLEFLEGVAWSGSQFVAFGGGGTIIHSEDGRTWTTADSGTSEFLYGVAWSGSQFVAVGEDGMIVRSEDGITWIGVTVATNDFYDVVWSGSRFVAVGEGGTIIHSEDGRTWTTADSGTSKGLEGVAWSGSQFVAVGWGAIIHSEDGRTWTTADIGTLEFLEGVAWSGSQFVAVGGRGTIIHSEDGRTWTTADSGTSEFLYGVAWSGSQFVAVGGGGTIIHSEDGRTWTTADSGTSKGLEGVAWSGSQFVAVGWGAIIHSEDGRTWTTADSGTSEHLEGVAWSGSQFVAVGEGGTIIHSEDGRTWTTADIGTSEHLYGVAWSGSVLVLVGKSGTVISLGASN